MLPPLDRAAILEEVVVSTRRAFCLLPDMQVIERPGWLQLVTPSFAGGGFNEVAQSQLSADEADAVIDATLAQYRDLGIVFRWRVSPGDTPADLGARLSARGLRLEPGRGMARDTAPLLAPLAAGSEIVEVDAARLADYTRTMAQGWNVAADPLARAHAVIFAAGAARRDHLFLALVNGQPAATASYIAFPRSAYLLGAVVLPPFRRRGLYRALVAARLAHARERGLTLATSLAREASSAPILERLGFETLCAMGYYASPAPGTAAQSEIPIGQPGAE